MKCLTVHYHYSLILSFCVVLASSNFTTVGPSGRNVVEGITNGSLVESTTELFSLKSKDVPINGSLLLKMATMCETPNNDVGLCIEIKQCSLLMKQLNNSNARQFLRASRCGPKNEDPLNPKVCCGRYSNFRNVSKNIVDDDTIFPKSCGTQRIIIRGRIIGGKEAALGEYPWMARLIHKNKYGYKTFGCSGFLVHVKYVITAGHCTHPDLIQARGPVYSVLLGEHNIETRIDCSPAGVFCAEPTQTSRVEKVIVHPEYDPNTSGHYNDIAIIHLRKGARMSDFVKPICLLKDSSRIPGRYYLSGWGKTEQASSSKIKMKVELPAFDKLECQEKYSLLSVALRGTQICAGGEELKDSCTGDSGGPLMMSSSNGTYYASGIVSYGIGCGIKGWPGVYTSIPDYIPWIKSQIVLNSMLSTKSNHKKTRKRKGKKAKVPKIN